MSQKVRIKDIAKMANVSAGTVDRVLHNRGGVSAASKQAVEKALNKLNYRPNLHISAISLKKKYHIVIIMPIFEKGEYWTLTHRGIQRAVNEYAGLDIKCQFLYFDQFDLYSYREIAEKALETSPDGLIIVPTFRDEAMHLCYELESKEIPYVFVDSMIEGTRPLAFFSSNLYSTGYLICKIITSITPEDSELVIFQTVRVGDASANTTILRKQGFMDYLRDNKLKRKIHSVPFSVTDPQANKEYIGDFFKDNPQVRGAIVLSSRGNVVADYFRENNIKDVDVICIDLTDENIKALKSKEISYIIGQRPERQGFMAIKTLIQHLVYGTLFKQENFMPLDIITFENLDFYYEFEDITF